MSNYIIAGEAGNPDLSDCEYLGKKLEASTPNTNVHIIAKHSTEWDQFLKKLCNSYGFREPSNPIIFTVDGKLIGDKYAFKDHVVRNYSVRGELDKNMKALISEFDKSSLENHRQKLADGPSVKERVKNKIVDIVQNGGIRILDGFFEPVYDQGFEFWVRTSNMLSPFTFDEFDQWGESLEFADVPELMPPKIESEVFSPRESKVTDEFPGENEEKLDEDRGSEPIEKEKSPSQVDSPIPTGPDEASMKLSEFEADDKNIKNLLEFFVRTDASPDILYDVVDVQVPSCIKTIPIYDLNIVRDLPKDYLLALSPYPLIPGEMVIFSGKMIENGWLLRDFSMMQSWLKILTIPPQRIVYRDGELSYPMAPKEPVFLKDVHGNTINQRGFSCRTLDLNLQCTRDPYYKMHPINIYLRHIITELDWEIWLKTIRDLGAIGYYQLLPYGQMNFHPIRSGQLLLSMLPINGISINSFEELVNKYGDEQEFFTIPEFKFDHVLCNFPKNAGVRVISEFFLMGVERLRINHQHGPIFDDCGMNLIVTGTFMMIVPVYRPFATVQGRNLYPDPLWYVGVVSLPVLPKCWPETVGEANNKTPFELLVHCSKYKI